LCLLKCKNIISKLINPSARTAIVERERERVNVQTLILTEKKMGFGGSVGFGFSFFFINGVRIFVPNLCPEFLITFFSF
jgi:hypothetical protein